MNEKNWPGMLWDPALGLSMIRSWFGSRSNSESGPDGNYMDYAGSNTENIFIKRVLLHISIPLYPRSTEVADPEQVFLV